MFGLRFAENGSQLFIKTILNDIRVERQQDEHPVAVLADEARVSAVLGGQRFGSLGHGAMQVARALIAYAAQGKCVNDRLAAHRAQLQLLDDAELCVEILRYRSGCDCKPAA